MSGNRLLLDSNILIYLSKRHINFISFKHCKEFMWRNAFAMLQGVWGIKFQISDSKFQIAQC